MDLCPAVSHLFISFWDPDYPKWALGKVSALKELVFNNLLGLKYYYMGYHTEDCPKMNYKEKYGGTIGCVQ